MQCGVWVHVWQLRGTLDLAQCSWRVRKAKKRGDTPIEESVCTEPNSPARLLLPHRLAAIVAWHRLALRAGGVGGSRRFGAFTHVVRGCAHIRVVIELKKAQNQQYWRDLFSLHYV